MKAPKGKQLEPLEFLLEAGPLLYGPQWQTAVAADLGVSPRMVRFWVAGQYKVPDDVPQRLQAVFRRVERADMRKLEQLRALFGAGSTQEGGDD